MLGRSPTTQEKQMPDENTQIPDLSAVKRMSVTLSADAAELLEWLATTQGITQVEALRKAIATEAYLYKEIKQGSKVLLLNSEKEVREVLFR
jgi:hypothetical protein